MTKAVQLPPLEKEGKTCWDSKTRKFEKIHNETYLRRDTDTMTVLEGIPNGVLGGIAEEVSFHLKQRKCFERQKPTMHLLLLTLHKIEERIKEQASPDVQKALRKSIRDVLYLKRGRGTGRITYLHTRSVAYRGSVHGPGYQTHANVFAMEFCFSSKTGVK